jgi:hypothetical protein
MGNFLRYAATVSVFFVVLYAFLAPNASGQASSGTIIGAVTDPSEAGVPDAKVTVTDKEKGLSFSTTTNNSGYYTITNLNPGNYRVTIEAKGFKTSVQENVPVIVGSSSTVNLILQVGGVGETVTVDATPPLLETDRAAVGTEMSSRQVESLPVLNRNFTELELLLPGTAKMPWQHGQTENPQGGIQINTNGQLFSGTNFMIDGMDNTDPVLGIIMINPPIDSIQEFKATTGNFDTEFSQAGGSVIQAQVKSGTNEYHGSLFEFLQNNDLAAHDPFVTVSPLVPPLHWNQFGGSIGGPFKKNKLFGFFDYQGTRQRNGGSAQEYVPTDSERAGDLSDLGVPIYDPTTGNPDGTGRTQFVSFPNGPNANSLCTNAAGCPNMIPTSRISAPSAALLALLPAPNLTGTAPGENNYSASGVQKFNTNQFDIKIDHYLTEKLRYFARYSYGGYQLNTPGAYGDVGGPQLNGLSFEGISDVRNQNGVGALTYIVSPSLLGDFRFGVTRYRVFVSAPDETKQLATQVGIPGINDPNRKDTWGLPDFSVGGTGGFSQLGFQCNCPLDQEETEFQGATNWTKTRGNHTIKWGADVRHRQNKRLPSDQHRAGVYAFNAGVTSDASVAGSGLAIASFLLGDPSAFNRFAQISTNQQDVQWSMYYYVEDVWRLTSKLSLNYGLRWDTWFADTSLNSGQGGRYDVTTNTVFIPGVGGVSQSGGVKTQYHNISPRIGIAYSLNPKTVIRGGWGRSFFQGTFGWTFNTLAADVYPSIVNQSIPQPSAFLPVDFGTPVAPCGSPLCTAPPSATDLFPAIPSSGRLPLPDGIGTSNIPTNQKMPYVDSWNLMVERQVYQDATFSIGYVGNVGRHLNGGWNLNAPVPGPGPNTSRQPLFAAFGLTQDIFNKCDCVNSNYNALQIKFTKRFSRHYSILSSYTWAKALDFGEFGTESNQYDYHVDHGPAVFDRASIFTLGHTVLLPFGHGQRWGSDWNSVVNTILGGWEWTGITTVESGLPFSVTENNTTLNTFDMTLRPDRAGNPFSGTCPSTGASTHARNCWFNPGEFSTPALYQFGNTSRNSLRGPGLFTANWGLDKHFRLSERFDLQFRWEVFNAFNRANLQNPDNNISDTKAGVISDISSPMRNQQLGLHLTF